MIDKIEIQCGNDFYSFIIGFEDTDSVNINAVLSQIPSALGTYSYTYQVSGGKVLSMLNIDDTDCQSMFYKDGVGSASNSACCMTIDPALLISSDAGNIIGLGVDGKLFAENNVEIYVNGASLTSYVLKLTDNSDETNDVSVNLSPLRQITSALTVNGVVYPIGTDFENILIALIAYQNSQSPSSAETLTNKTLDSYTNHIGADHLHIRIKANENISYGDCLQFVGFNAGQQAIEVIKRIDYTKPVIGISHDTLTTGEFGLAVSNGLLKNVNTIAYSEGTILYGNNAGGFSDTPSSITNAYNQQLAYIVRSHAVNGEIMINVGSTIPNGTTSQYRRGDNTWQTLDKSAVGLSNVPNVDATNPANIAQATNYRFATDTEKGTWNGKQNALGSLTSGAVLFGNGTNSVNFDANNLFFNSSTKNFGIGGMPSTKLEIFGALNSITLQVRGGGVVGQSFGARFFTGSNNSDYALNIRNFNDSVQILYVRGDGNVGIGTSSPTSKLQVVGLPVYADNTAALAGGLTGGAFYRTATGVLMVAY